MLPSPRWQHNSMCGVSTNIKHSWLKIVICVHQCKCVYTRTTLKWPVREDWKQVLRCLCNRSIISSKLLSRFLSGIIGALCPLWADRLTCCLELICLWTPWIRCHCSFVCVPNDKIKIPVYHKMIDLLHPVKKLDKNFSFFGPTNIVN